MIWWKEFLLIISVISKMKSELVENVKFNTGLLFPETTTVGMLAAAVIPLDLQDKSVFLSFGFEEYYLLPHKNYHWFPPDAGRSNYENEQFPLLTRNRAYSILIRKLNLFGFNGKECLLRTICEVNASPLANHNGVLGHILQIIFTPTASEAEGLGNEYYEAESNGHDNHCIIYHDDCPVSLVDMFTKEFYLHL